jgi:elongation factor G-like protein
MRPGNERSISREQSAEPGHARAAQSAKHPEYPLERLCTHRFEPFQLTFARHAQQLFDGRHDVELVASHRGLTIRAETEDAIDAALSVLHDFYGPQIRVEPPTVRYHDGVTLEQPWMGLRIRCAPEHLESVRNDLIVRDATLVSCERQHDSCAVQARAPLVHLLGYRSALEKLTSGSAEYAMWLSHYAPVENLPPEGDAA